MELSAIRAISNLTVPHHMLFTPVRTQSVLQCKPHFPLLLKKIRLNSGLRCYKDSSVTSVTSEETPTEATTYLKDEPDGVTKVEDESDGVTKVEDEADGVTKVEDEPNGVTAVEDEPDGVITVEDEPDGVITVKDETDDVIKVEDETDDVIKVEDALPVEENEDYSPVTQSNEKPQEDSLVDDPMKLFSFLENLDIKDIKFDSENTYSILAFGGGAFLALWLASAVVRAIDSIPVFPKVLELVGLAYTVWFTARYLVFEENRAELAAKVKQIKEEVIGLEDD